MTNEPTTGEIVRALRCDGDANNCVDCRYATYDTATILCDQEQNVRDAADRLESQERENASLRAENEGLHKEILRRGIEIKTMTARAESAERERDELVDLIPHTCNTCYFQSKNLLNEEPCVSCRIYSKWTWRGLQPQDGEGK